MKGDFSRFSHDPARRYTRVLMQQGRVQTDADWNEQAGIAASRHASAITDIIGQTGGPEDHVGFSIDAFGGGRFDGVSTSVGIRLHRSCRLGEDFTLEGWIKIAARGAPGTLLSGLSPGEPHRETFRIQVGDHGRLMFLRLAEGASPGEGAAPDDDPDARPSREVISRDPLPIGRFVHVAAVSREGHVALFIDGEAQGRARRASAAPGAIGAFVVGCHHGDGGPAGFFSGQIDRIRLWEASLDTGTLTRIATLGDIRAPPHPRHDWRFGALGKVVTDINGHSEVARRLGHHPPIPARPEIRVGGGRYYIQGSPCDQDGRRPFPGLGETSPDTRIEAQIAYLESWDRVRVGGQDPGLLDPALGGLDTSARLQTAWRVRFARGEAIPDRAIGGRRGALALSGAPDETVDNRLARVEIHYPGFAAGQAAPAAGARPEGLEIEVEGRFIKLAEPNDGPWPQGRLVELVRPGLESALQARVLSARRDADDGLWRLELSWARVEPKLEPLSRWRLRPIATFKWSLDNGAWAFRVIRGVAEAAGGATASVDMRADQSALIDIGSWTEIVGEAAEAARLPGVMARVVAIDQTPDDPQGPVTGEDAVALTLSDGPDAPFDGSILRLWDGIGLGDTAVGHQLVDIHKPQALRGGLRVSFGAGYYDCGDYWVCAIRGALDWPTDARRRPAFMPPQGPTIRTAPLAMVRFDGGATRVDDLRQRFPTLTGSTERIDAALRAAISGPGGLADRVEAAVAEATHRLGEAARERVADETRRAIEGLPGWPPEHCILTFHKTSHPGWRHEDMRLSLAIDEPQWTPLETPPRMGWPVGAATLPEGVFRLGADGELHRMDLEHRRWVQRAACPEADARFTALVALEGRIHALGSAPDGKASIHAVYDPGEDAWSRREPIPDSRAHCGFAAWNHRLYAVGGRKPADRRPLAVVEAYDPERDQWQAFEPLPEPVSDCAAIGVSGQLYVVGGQGAVVLGLRDRATDRIRIFSPDGGGWRDGPTLAHARRGAGVAVTGKRLHVVGGLGRDGKVKPDEMFDVAYGMRLPAPQSLHLGVGGVIVAADGILYRFSHIPGQEESLGEYCVFERALYLHSRIT